MKGEERIMRGWIKEEGDLIEDDIVCADGEPVPFETYQEAMESIKDVEQFAVTPYPPITFGRIGGF